MNGEANQFFDKSQQKVFLKADDLASRLGVSKKTVYGRIYRRLIPFKKIGPRLIRFDPNDIEQWILQTKEKS